MLPDNAILQDRYRIIEQIGRGGMGAVYRALDTRLRATVALKQTMVEGEPLRKAFEREAQLLASLRHPTLPHVSDHFIDERGQFLVMEYIPGEDFGHLIQQRNAPFPVADVLRWADQLLDALDYLHTRTPSIIHRDIKPQNMKLTDRSEIVLLDFGLAKSTAVQTRVTSTGSIFGYTPHYAPLEQIHDMGTDPRSDLYALAATLFHLLTNQVPIDAATRAAAKVNDEPDPLPAIRTLNPAVPPAVAEVLEQALSQRASTRPASAALMRTMLQEAAIGIAPAPPISVPVVAAPTSQPTVIDGSTVVVPTSQPTVIDGSSVVVQNKTQPSQRRWGRAALAVPIFLVLLAGAFFAVRAFGSADPSAITPQTQLVAGATGPATATDLPETAQGIDNAAPVASSFTTRTVSFPDGKIVNFASSTGVKYRYEILDAAEEYQSPGKSLLHLTVRAWTDASGGLNFWSDSFRLMVGGRSIAPSNDLNILVARDETQDGDVEFPIDGTISDAVLNIKVGGVSFPGDSTKLRVALHDTQAALFPTAPLELTAASARRTVRRRTLVSM